MNISKEVTTAEEKKYENEGEKSPAADTPALFPLFPFGLFLFPLIIPNISPAEMKDVK